MRLPIKTPIHASARASTLACHPATTIVGGPAKHTPRGHAPHLVFALMLVAGTFLSPGFASASESCARWSAGEEESEGGPMMTARICAGDGDGEAELFLQCVGPEAVWLRMIPPPSLADYPPGGGDYQSAFAFDTGAGPVVEIPLRHEAMDAAMAGTLEPRSPLITALSSGTDVTIVSTDGKVGPYVFTLNGAADALKALAAACR